MKTAPLLVALVLATVALPLASAGHTVDDCMNIWRDAPPGWDDVCVTTDWLVHNPVSPLAACLLAPLEYGVVGVWYDLKEGLACI